MYKVLLLLLLLLLLLFYKKVKVSLCSFGIDSHTLKHCKILLPWWEDKDSMKMMWVRGTYLYDCDTKTDGLVHQPNSYPDHRHPSPIPSMLIHSIFSKVPSAKKINLRPSDHRLAVGLAEAGSARDMGNIHVFA
jgi:hypothetical protein